MRFKIDENLHASAAELLRCEGYDAETVVAEGLRGCIDFELARHCRVESRALITLDLDFADIRAFPPVDMPGIVVLRLRSQDWLTISRVLRQVIELLKTEKLAGRLWIATENSVRIREG